ncbi:hypothetical protein OVY01_11815 [Robbsia sp. Bb-Pol-6]|uniref:Uncharacterized protein n=1 Tax=Robbsia betulipollinis TaxID=2981849 RepID=A0ABT3ZMY6_9BURK|nr:hypothetical protein [Robbsia betulipollinis]MCY0387909.1 hypothetical protein [Robbsia betulipollinis]
MPKNREARRSTIGLSVTPQEKERVEDRFRESNASSMSEYLYNLVFGVFHGVDQIDEERIRWIAEMRILGQQLLVDAQADRLPFETKLGAFQTELEKFLFKQQVNEERLQRQISDAIKERSRIEQEMNDKLETLIGIVYEATGKPA